MSAGPGAPSRATKVSVTCRPWHNPTPASPVLENMKVVYKQTPEEMVAELPALLDSGVNIVGGCCGSTPEHIRLFREVIDRHQETQSP